jgi:endonuclease G
LSGKSPPYPWGTVPSKVIDRLASVKLLTTRTGCGLLAARGLVLTCHHVLPNRSAARSATVTLGVDAVVAPDGTALVPARGRRFDAGRFLSCESLDYTVAAIHGQQTLGIDLLSGVPWASPVLGEALVIVEFKPTRPVGLRLTRTRVSALVGPLVQYSGPTVYGSSGAPVFNRSWQLVAIHHKRGFLPASDGSLTLTSEGVCLTNIAADVADRTGGYFGVSTC